MLSRKDPTLPRKRGRPPGSRNKVFDASPHLKMTILHKVANLPEHRDLTPNQVFDEGARAIHIHLRGSANLNTKLAASNIKRHKTFLVREQEYHDNAWLHDLNALLLDYYEYCSDREDYDPETGVLPGCLLSFETWSEVELARLDHEFPPLPQGLTLKVATNNPSFKFVLRLKATRRRRGLNVPSS